MASTDARAFPTKNTAYRVTFPILDADGDLVTGATGLDSEVSKDGGTFADCTNEATEIATASGMYYLDLTSTEMNADTVAIIVKTSSSGAKTTPMVFYPATLSVAQLGVNAVQLGGTAQTGRDVGASVLLSSGTGTGQISLSSGAVLLQATQTGVTIPTVTTLTNLPAITSNWLTAAGIAASALNGKGDWNVGKTGYSLTATTGLGNQTANITGNLSGSVGSVTTVSDKTGYALSSAGVQAIWDALTSALTTASSIGKLLVDNINATISSRSTYAGGDTSGTTTLLSRIVGTLASGTHNAQSGDAYARLGAPAGASVSADVAAIHAKTTNLPAAPASTTNITAGTITTVTNLTNAPTAGDFTATMKTSLNAATPAVTVSDKTGFSLSAAGVDAVWDEVLSGHLTAGTTGAALNGATAPSAASVADAVWDEALSGHLSAGTTGEALNGAGAAGDPWTTGLPGAYGAGSAGYILGTNLNATVSSRSSHSAADVWSSGTRTLTSFGTLIADIWAYATRTLTAISDSSGVTTLLSRIASALTITTGKVDVNDKTGFSISGTKTTLDALNDLSAANVRTAVGLASANLDTQLADLPTNAELTSALASADDATLAAIAALNDLSSADVTSAVPTAAQNATAVLAAATANPIDANVQEVNDVALVGNGSTTPWGPA